MRSTRAKRLSVALAIGAVAALLPLGLRSATAATSSLFDFPCSSASQAGDFNNDGRPDLAAGAPGDDLEQVEIDGSITEGVDNAGSISVVYSDSTGLNPKFTPDPTSKKFFSQNSPGVRENAEKDDHFGFSVVSGNFNGIGGDDLAVGIPGENGGAGAVQVFYSGGANTTTTDPADTVGLTTFSQLITQGTPGIEGTAESGDAFGYALAAADINDDGVDDLVVGAPREDLSSKKDAGVIHVIYGTFVGLSATAQTSAGGVVKGRNDQLFEQGPGQIKSPEIGRRESGDFFGASLVVGHFNNDSRVDVAIGAPGEDIGSAADAGAVKILYGRGDGLGRGLSLTEADFFHANSPQVAAAAQTGDRFGCALAAGDFDGDDDDDLAIGIPGKKVGADAAAGAVSVIYNSGRTTGLSADPQTNPPAGTFWSEDQFWTEDAGGIPGVSKPNDRMGASFAVGDFDTSGQVDLAVGLPTEQLYDHKASGSVRVLYGRHGDGITDISPSAFAQSPTDLPSSCLLYTIIDTCLAGPTDYSPLWMVEEENDMFGSSLAAANYDGTGGDDIVIGVPGEGLGQFVNWILEDETEIPDELLTQFGIPVPLEIDEVEDAGAMHVVYGPFPTPAQGTPAKQDVLYRSSGNGGFPLGTIRGVLHSIPDPIGPALFPDFMITEGPADPSYTGALGGDALGSSTN